MLKAIKYFQNNSDNNSQSIIRNYIVWFFFSIVMLIVLLVRIRLLNTPLERDEGEYAYMGQLMLQGIPPFEIAYNMKLPGTHFMYAFFMSIFGQTAIGIHIGLLVINLCSILFIFLLARKIISNNAGLIAAATYAILSLSNSVFGFAAHATHFLIFPAIAGIFILYKTINSDKKIWYFLSGLLLGIVPIMKQQGVFFCVFGALFLIISFFIYKKIKIKTFSLRFLLFALGGLIPFTLILIILKLSGVFNKFWFWTFQYAIEYEQQVGINDAFSLFKRMSTVVIKDFYLIWIFAALGIIALFFHPKLKKSPSIFFILLFTIFSFLSVCPGFYFRSHYFIVFLPAIAILFSVFIDFIIHINWRFKLIKYLSYSLLIIPILLGLISQKDYLFKLNPKAIIKNTYGYSNPFIEAVKIAEYVKLNSTKKDKIAIIGSEPQIFFYSDRISATGYIFTFSLKENQNNKYKMQKEMIHEIESSHPKLIIYFHDSIYYISKWINPYLQKYHYQITGVVDIYKDQTIYKWNNEALNYIPRSETYAIIYKR